MSKFDDLQLRLENDDEEKQGIDEGGDLAVETAKPKLKPPSMYKVIMLNDDYTPMDFVIEVLESIFGMDRANATQVMLMVHTKGKGVCGIYPKDIAETKALLVNDYAKECQHPLLCHVDKAD